MRTREEKIEIMDTALAVVIVLFLQFFADKFRDEVGDNRSVADEFVDNLIEAYCDVLGDKDHAQVFDARMDAVFEKWFEICDEAKNGTAG